MTSNLALNILLGVVCLGFVWFIWAGGLSSGPEGPVGAWIVPVPFLLLLLAVMAVCIVRGRFDWLPGGKTLAFVLLAGFMVAVGAALLAAFERRDSALDYVYWLIPFVTLAGCFWASGGLDAWVPARTGRILGPAIFGLTSLAGWGLMGQALVARVHSDMQTAERQSVREQADQEARAARAAAEFRALPPNTPLFQVIQFEYVSNEAVQKEVRARIANWPALDDELSTILNSDTLSILDMSWTISYIADIYPSPPARLGPAYAHALDKAYRYWESTMKYDENAAKSEQELSVLMRGAERIQKAGGDLRPHLRPWYELLKQARGLGGLAGYVQDVIRGR